MEIDQKPFDSNKVNGGTIKSIVKNLWNIDKVVIADKPFSFFGHIVCAIFLTLLSLIDAQSEIKIFERLNKLAKDKIVIFISHRFTTVRQANKICVIEEGVITEMGTHQELLANKKTYANLFQMQARSYEE